MSDNVICDNNKHDHAHSLWQNWKWIS